MPKGRPTFRERVAALAAERAREVQFIREMQAKYPARTPAEAEEDAAEFAFYLTREPLHRYSELFAGRR